MSEKEYRTLKRQMRVLTFLVMVFIFMQACSIVHSYLSPKSRSFPQTTVVSQIGQVGAQGTQGSQGIQGMQGIQGQSVQGIQGVTGNAGAQGVAGVQGDKGDKGDTGEQGIQGEPADTIELRTNPKTGDMEWKYSSDGLWTILYKKCQITNCEVL